jgi:hypothetical protein
MTTNPFLVGRENLSSPFVKEEEFEDIAAELQRNFDVLSFVTYCSQAKIEHQGCPGASGARTKPKSTS